MNLHVCALALLLFGSIATVRGRAVDLVDDSNDVDNSIEAEEEKPRNRAFEADWLKFTKTPPTKLQQADGATIEIVCEMMGSQVPSIQWVVGHLPRPMSVLSQLLLNFNQKAQTRSHHNIELINSFIT